MCCNHLNGKCQLSRVRHNFCSDSNNTNVSNAGKAHYLWIVDVNTLEYR